MGGSAYKKTPFIFLQLAINAFKFPCIVTLLLNTTSTAEQRHVKPTLHQNWGTEQDMLSHSTKEVVQASNFSILFKTVPDLDCSPVQPWALTEPYETI